MHEPPSRIRTFLDLACSRSPDAGDRLLELLNRTVHFPWQDLLRCSIETYLAPALPFELACKGTWSQLPLEARNILEEIADLNRSRNRKILATISHISATLNRSGIASVFLKGAACLASGTYRDTAVRFMVDIDLLVPKAHCKDAIRTLLDSGYQQLSTDPWIGKHYPPLLSPDGLIALEVHRCLGRPSVMLPPEEVLQQAVALNIDGVSICVPRKEHILAHQILHAQDRWRDRLWPLPHQVYDLSLLVDTWHGAVEWAALTRRLVYQGNVPELRRLSASALALLEAVRAGHSVFSAKAPPRNNHDRLLRRFPAFRYVDPFYMSDTWVSGKVSRLVARVITRGGAAWLCRRIATREFWSRAAAELKSV